MHTYFSVLRVSINKLIIVANKKSQSQVQISRSESSFLTTHKRHRCFFKVHRQGWLILSTILFILQAAVTTMDAMTELVYELDGSTLEKFFMAGESKVCNFSDKCLFQKLQKLFGYYWLCACVDGFTVPMYIIIV